MAKFIIVVGIIITLAGVIYYFFGDYFKWIGNMPGDIKIEKENFSFYFPITTMLIFSLLYFVISRIVIWIIK